MIFKKLPRCIVLTALSIISLSTNSFAQITDETYSTQDLARYSNNFVALPSEMNAVLFSFMNSEYILPPGQDLKENIVSAEFLGLSFTLSLLKNSDTRPAFILTKHVHDIENPKDEEKVIYTHMLFIHGINNSGLTLYTMDHGQSWFFELSENYHVPYEKERQLYLISAALTAHMLNAKD